jgi:hypothetical protein
MEIMVNDYDKRQLELMLKKIILYRQDASILLNLINDLGSLVDVLETIDDSWKEELRSWLWNLEEIYAVALDRKQQSLDAEDLRIIENALDKIEFLIMNQI